MPRPDLQPQRLTSPQTSPFTSMQSALQPAIRGATQILTRLRRDRLTSPQVSPLAQLLNKRRDDNCPPCEKEVKEARTECYKKLVKEGLFEDLDTEYNWVEIDCVTGSEL